MSWYNIIKQSMPLPRSKEEPKSEQDTDDYWAWDNYTSTKNKLDTRLGPEEMEDPEGELEWLGAGYYGMAYTPSSDGSKVVKYTSDLGEMSTAKAVMQWQKANGGFSPYITGLYEFKMIPNKEVARIVTEKVKPLIKEEKSILADFKYNAQNAALGRNNYGTIEQIRASLESDLKRGKYNWDTDEHESNEQRVIDKTLLMFDKFVAIVKGLSAMGLSPTDLHGNNLGWRENGDLVALDYGRMGGDSSPPSSSWSSQ
jgi:hypothetical protein